MYKIKLLSSIILLWVVYSCEHWFPPKTYAYDGLDLIVTVKWLDPNHYRVYLNSKKRIITNEDYIDCVRNEPGSIGATILFSPDHPEMIYINDECVKDVRLHHYDYCFMNYNSYLKGNWDGFNKFIDDVYENNPISVEFNEGDHDIRFYRDCNYIGEPSLYKVDNSIFNTKQ